MRQSIEDFEDVTIGAVEVQEETRRPQVGVVEHPGEEIGSERIKRRGCDGDDADPGETLGARGG